MFDSIWFYVGMVAAIWIVGAFPLYIYLGPWLVEEEYLTPGAVEPYAVFWPILGGFWLLVAIIVSPLVLLFLLLYKPSQWAGKKYDQRMEAVKERKRQAQLRKWEEEDAARREDRKRQEECEKKWKEEQEAMKKNQPQPTFREPEKEPSACPHCGMKPFEPTPREETEVRAPGSEFL